MAYPTAPRNRCRSPSVRKPPSRASMREALPSPGTAGSKVAMHVDGALGAPCWVAWFATGVAWESALRRPPAQLRSQWCSLTGKSIGTVASAPLPARRAVQGARAHPGHRLGHQPAAAQHHRRYRRRNSPILLLAPPSGAVVENSSRQLDEIPPGSPTPPTPREQRAMPLESRAASAQ